MSRFAFLRRTTLLLLVLAGPLSGTAARAQAHCGDGTAQPALGEQCDDGNLRDQDGCDTNCRESIVLQLDRGESTGTVSLQWTGGLPGFGVHRSETASDLGHQTHRVAQTTGTEWLDAPPPASLLFYQVSSLCGDGTVDDGEACDDGNTVDDDDCRSDCTLPLLPDPATVIQLPLDEGTGTEVYDVGPGGHTGTLLNGAGFDADTPDGSPYAVRFDGIDDLIDLGRLDAQGSGLTLAAWFRADSFGGGSADPRIISKATGIAEIDHIFMLGPIAHESGIRLRGRVRVGGATTTVIAASGDLLPGFWRHAALTHDGVALRLFLDGLEVGSLPLVGTLAIAPTVPVAVGGQPPGAGARFFDGLIDDVRILQRALTPEEILAVATGNEPPVARDDAYETPEDTLLVVDAAAGVLDNDLDVEGDPLEATLLTDAQHGVVSLAADGSFAYTPAADFAGEDGFVYQATDGRQGSNPATVVLTVLPRNDAPVAVDDVFDTEPGAILAIDASRGVLANDVDPDGDDMQAALVDDVSHGLLTFNADGSFVYEPDPDFHGTDSFLYRAQDGQLVSEPATATIRLDTDNDPPRIVSGTMAFRRQIIDDEADPHYAVAADLNGDGRLDIVATDYEGFRVYWYENLGDGTFAKRIVDNSLVGAYPVHTADVDLDGDIDVLSIGYATIIAWYENDGEGNFTKHFIDTTRIGPHSVVTGDMDLDGDIDLLNTNQDEGSVMWYENDGSQNFTRHTIDDRAGGAKHASFADVDEDGDWDVLSAANFINEVAWYENDGSQGFTKHRIELIHGPYFILPADLDADGHVDAVTASQHDNTIRWYKNDGSGGFTSFVIDDTAEGARAVDAADVDGDGNLDVLSASPDDDTVAWYRNDGAGGFATNYVSVTADGAYGVFAIDMDFDGDVDVLSAELEGNSVSLHHQIRSHTAEVARGGTLEIGPELLLTVDVDDGPAALTYTVIDGPVFGQLQLDGTPLTDGSTLTQADIDAGRLTYVHDGGDTTSDGFVFLVADGGGNGVLPAEGNFTFVVATPSWMEGAISGPRSGIP